MPAELAAIRDAVAGLPPYMDEQQGRVVYEHIRRTRPERVLELGSGCGVSAAYIAGALEANGEGTLLSIDSDRADFPPPAELLERLELDHRAEFIRVPDSSYVWFLARQVAERSDHAGNCSPLYDFAFIDGAHELTIDGLGVVLVTKLLKPGGWLLLDDLSWTHALADTPAAFRLSAEQRSTPNMRLVFDLIVKQDPVYTEIREEDGTWGWAHKGAGEREVTLLTTGRSAAKLASARAAVLTRRAARP
jgi:predicted O-methyltransferase YrrM